MRSIVRTSESTIEPIDLAVINSHLKIQTTVEDSLLAIYQSAVRHLTENKINRALVPSEFVIKFDSFQDAFILPNPPISSSSTDLVITYSTQDTSTVMQTVSATCYTVDYDSEPGRVYLGYGQSWPTDIINKPNAVSILYRAGYSTATIPKPITQFMLMRIGDLYNHRESILTDEAALRYLRRDYIDGFLDEYIVY